MQDSMTATFNPSRILASHREYHSAGKIRPVVRRRAALESLRRSIVKHEADILEALKLDLNKPRFEAYASEIGMVIEEIDHALKHIMSWTSPLDVPTPLAHLLATSTVHREPHGVVLIMAPWNYPFYLLFTPLVGALAGGNCAMLKPSEISEHSARVIQKIVEDAFDPGLVSCVQGGPDTSRGMLELKFDYIFFTGSTAVGKHVMAAAARHLTPLTLELGGKSPCIVDSTVDLVRTARRIMWGKCINAGQTCIAPDYLLVEESIEEELMFHLDRSVHKLYGPRPIESPDLCRIVSQRHFDRLTAMLSSGKTVLGGRTDPSRLVIEPTVLNAVNEEDPVLQEEIFGPILPVITWREFDEVINHVRSRPRPLALYLFSEIEQRQTRTVQELSFGGGCINDTISHMVSINLPFGGAGESGMGAYHGIESFKTFTRPKSVLKRNSLDMPVKYPPYKDDLNLLKFFLG